MIKLLSRMSLVAMLAASCFFVTGCDGGGEPATSSTPAASSSESGSASTSESGSESAAPAEKADGSGAKADGGGSESK